MSRVYSTRDWRERFMDFVSQGHDGTGCWEWTGSTNGVGYGQFGKGEVHGTRYAHRIAYLEWVGPILEGTDLDHLCRNRGCCNPAHLEAVSRGENLLRGWAVRKPSLCHRGHDMADAYVNPRGLRECSVCKKSRDHARWAGGPGIRPKEFCKYGHPMEGENLYVSPAGLRQCRACRRRLSQEQDAKRKQARAMR